MAEPSASESSTATDSDQDFDPSAEMLINDFDDEHTLEEEEANVDCVNITNEIMDLQKEGEMPLEELLALYGYEQSSANKGEKNETGVFQESVVNQTDSNSDGSNSNYSYMDESGANASQDSHCNRSSTTTSTTTTTTNLRSAKQLEELPNQWSLPQSSSSLNNPNLMISMSQDASDMEDEDEDEDDEGVDDWRRTIQVGSDYQAQIPDGLNEYGDVPPYENEDKLLWDPTSLPEDNVVMYLRQIAQIDVVENLETLSNKGTNGSNATSKVPPPPIPSPPLSTTSSTLTTALKDTTNLPSTVRDDEAALYLLHQCGHNVAEALRRKRKLQNNSPFETMSSWSEEECKNFEEGIRLYGKDFHQIQKNKIPTRSVGELVQFYYLWKKTERHDIYASKWRIEKKKYSLHPGTTDYMDRFIDEQENMALQAHSFSSSSYTRQQSYGSYSIIQYNHNSSGGGGGGHHSLHPTMKDTLDNSNEAQTSSGSRTNGNSPGSGKTVSSSSGNTNENATRGTTATNDNLTNGLTRENSVQINSSNSNPSKMTPSSDFYSSSTNEYSVPQLQSSSSTISNITSSNNSNH